MFYVNVFGLLIFFLLQTLETPSMNTVNSNEIIKNEPQTTIVMCEELRKLNKFDSIIPQPLLNMYVY